MSSYHGTQDFITMRTILNWHLQNYFVNIHFNNILLSPKQWRLCGFLSKWLYEFLVHNTFCMPHPFRSLWFNNPSSDNYTGFVIWNLAGTWMYAYEFSAFVYPRIGSGLIHIDHSSKKPECYEILRTRYSNPQNGNPGPWWFVAPYSHQQYNN